MIAAGKTVDDVIDEYPYLDREDVRQAVGYSAAHHFALRAAGS